MKEQLYTIPVNDAFDADTECPVCAMYDKLQSDAIDFVMGASYMEDDVRMETNKKGFCAQHLPLMYKNQNRLGLGLMMLTYMDQQLKEMEKLAGKKRGATSWFSKSSSGDATADYMKTQQCTCYVCDRMKHSYERYLVTTLYLYNTDSSFRDKFARCKGFCMKHFGELHEMAPAHLSKSNLDEFDTCINRIMVENFKRVRDDLEWFTDKFDYRNADAPWKNSKDALIRAIQKTNAISVEEKAKK
ncbi:MAG: hypothetical protein J6Y26_04085 [Lachnospiraceae bacterium]|nr:hypothetical protein [Lachnospiraceae bacterium]